MSLCRHAYKHVLMTMGPSSGQKGNRVIAFPAYTKELSRCSFIEHPRQRLEGQQISHSRYFFIKRHTCTHTVSVLWLSLSFDVSLWTRPTHAVPRSQRESHCPLSLTCWRISVLQSSAASLCLSHFIIGLYISPGRLRHTNQEGLQIALWRPVKLFHTGICHALVLEAEMWLRHIRAMFSSYFHLDLCHFGQTAAPLISLQNNRHEIFNTTVNILYRSITTDNKYI